MTDVVCLALGSRGDFQPFLALALELKKRGRQVLVAGLEDYAELAQSVGLPFAPIGGRISHLMDWEMVYRSQRNPWELARVFRALVSPLLGKIRQDCAVACRGARLVLASTLGLVPAYELGLPVVPVHFHPVGATRDVPSVHFPWLPKGALSRTSHIFTQLVFWGLVGSRSRWRFARRVWAHQDRAVLYAYPPELLERPRDWPSHVQVCGPWAVENKLPAGPADLERFLAQGAPPVYIGFGSLLAGRDPDSITEMLVRALQTAGLRGLIYRGWGDLARTPLPSDIMAIDSVDHNWLFPQVHAVVTHGGIGTVVSALQAGVPPIVVPFFGDQKLWALRLESLGLSGPAIPRARLNAESLVRALTTLPTQRLLLPNRTGIAAQTVEALLDDSVAKYNRAH